MKSYLVILLLVFLSSCTDRKTSRDSSSADRDTLQNIPLEKMDEDRDQTDIEEERVRDISMADGRYRKQIHNEPAADCNCNCIDISFDDPTEWCIIKDKTYITARCVQTGENTADVFLVNVSRDTETERPLPWEDFDTDTPIASIEFHPDGSADVDWIGFSTDGKLATDYAIFGKKTLEGTYKRE